MDPVDPQVPTPERRDPQVVDRRTVPSGDSPIPDRRSARGGRRQTDRPRDVTSRELADAADVTTQFIAAECRQGELRNVSYRIGPYWRILRTAAETFLRRRHIPLARLRVSGEMLATRAEP